MTGDIVLQKWSGWLGYLVSFFTKSEWVHCGISIDDWEVVHVDLFGKHTTPLCEWSELGGVILFLTPKNSLSRQEQFFLLTCCNNEKVQSYAYWHAIKSWFWKNPDDEKRNGKRYTCSSFVSAMYRKIGIDLVPNRSDDSTQPQDFLESPYLKRRET